MELSPSTPQMRSIIVPGLVAHTEDRDISSHSPKATGQLITTARAAVAQPAAFTDDSDDDDDGKDSCEEDAKIVAP